MLKKAINNRLIIKLVIAITLTIIVISGVFLVSRSLANVIRLAISSIGYISNFSPPHFILTNYTGQPVASHSNIQLLQQTIRPEAKLVSFALAPRLLGNINNELGIRRDILEYILTNIPATNVGAINAAIRFSQYTQQIYYNSDPEQQREYAVWLGNAIECMEAFLGLESAHKVGLDIAHLYRNTKLRAIHMHNVEANVLSGHIYPAITGNLATSTQQEGYKFCRQGGVYWR